jgi:hypothetical protein
VPICLLPQAMAGGSGSQACSLALVGPPHVALPLGPASLPYAVPLLAPAAMAATPHQARPAGMAAAALTKLTLRPWLGMRVELALLVVAATTRAASLEAGATRRSQGQTW